MNKIKRPHPTLVMFRDYESCRMYLHGQSLKSIVKFTKVAENTTKARIRNKITHLCNWYMCEQRDKHRLLRLLDWEITKRDLKSAWLSELIKDGGDTYNRSLDYERFIVVDGVGEVQYRNRVIELCIALLSGTALETLEANEHPFIRDAIKFYMEFHLDTGYGSFGSYCRYVLMSPFDQREDAINTLRMTFNSADTP